MMLSKALQLEDYVMLREAGGLAPYVEALARVRGAGYDVYEPHEHRAWEYASGVAALKEGWGGRIAGRCVANVGAGYTAMGAAMAMLGARVEESDLRQDVRGALEGIAAWSRGRGHAHTVGEWHDITHVAPSLYDAVMCISTIEHVAREGHDEAWRNLMSAVAPRGLLYVTTDYAPTWEGMGREREVGYTPDDVRERVEELRRGGFEVEADYAYYGALVSDYTFYRIIARRGL